MDIKRNHEGQVVQKNSGKKTTDTHLTSGESDILPIGFTIGKDGSVETYDIAITDFTHEKGGPTPLHPDQSE